MSDPRLEHNMKLCEEFVRAHRVTSRYPKVSEQVELFPLEQVGLFTFGYNPTIYDSNGAYGMLYRYHPKKSVATRLALATVSYSGSVLFNADYPLPGGSVEDPRLFKFHGMSYFSYVDSTWPENPPKSVVKYAFAGDPLPGQPITPRMPGNDGKSIQKNWVFFEYNNTLHCIYQTYPEQIVYTVNGDEISPPMRSPGPKHAYGPIKGGTAPLPYEEGAMVRFAHSTLDNEWHGHHRRYFIVAVLHDPRPPFAILAVSKKPIIYGSEIDDIPVSERPAQWKSNVVFPGGAVHSPNGDYLVALGINDSACAIARIPPDKLNL